MRVLVTAASRHGATQEIAETIAGVLAGRGLDVTITPMEDVANLDDVAVVVAGSAVYTGHWLGGATAFLKAHAEALRAKAVWLFSSGPIGDPPKPAAEALDIAELVEVTGARGHQTFAGKVDGRELSLAERLVVKMVKAPDGDYRDWDAIRAWAAEVADQLEAAPVPARLDQP